MMPQSLQNLVENRFDAIVRSRGETYFDNGRVELISAAATEARFQVYGTRLYTVTVGNLHDAEKITYSCSCPHHQDGESCKHIWASIIAIDRNGYYSQYSTSLQSPNKNNRTHSPAHKISANWQQKLARIEYGPSESDHNGHFTYPAERQIKKLIHYAIDLEKTIFNKRIVIDFYAQDILKNGSPGSIKPIRISHETIKNCQDHRDREILSSMLGKAQPIQEFSNYYPTQNNEHSHLTLSETEALPTLSLIQNTGRLYLLRGKKQYAQRRHKSTELMPYQILEGSIQFSLILKSENDSYTLNADIAKSPNESLSNIVLNTRDILTVSQNFVFFKDFMIRNRGPRFSNWITLINNDGPIEINKNEINQFLDYYFTHHKIPLSLPSELQFKLNPDVLPIPQIIFSYKNFPIIEFKVFFKYGDQHIEYGSQQTLLTDSKKRQHIERNTTLESSAIHRLSNASPQWRDLIEYYGSSNTISENNLNHLIEAALEAEWQPYAEGSQISKASDFEFKVNSGINWFDINAQVKFDDHSISLPELLENIRRGDNLIQLGNGRTGILPDALIKKLVGIAELGEETPSGIRLNKLQALLLQSQFEGHKLTGDLSFYDLKKILSQLHNLTESSPGKTFKGILRAYQKKGLSWLSLLTENKIGGVLADDMGLGKTIQILALLSKQRNPKKPSLIVAPKSLMFNWQHEINTFLPSFKVLILSGTKRRQHLQSLNNYDIILTTYPTLRMDIELLQNTEFEFLILDEAHNIKNPKAQSTLACRLINSKYKFALTGTPIENSLSDLFSIFDTICPGLISKNFAKKWLLSPNPEELVQLSTALSPFLLRRTKELVLNDLPEKSEQILMCELSEAERTKYDELKNYYWAKLSGKIEADGLNNSKFDVLEALLRLRQAACHQSLLSKSNEITHSSKFEVLLEHIETITKEGHKALIFSQFTSLLSLLKAELETRELNYCYLDGQTKDRSSVVKEFQENDKIKLFLLSIKAGGVGLNLTSADYVFILDPWWNPATEAQAIDRAHRIGQTKKVFAYKIIAKDTVEEKILELQKSKKQLADAIVTENQNLLKSLKLTDLQILLS